VTRTKKSFARGAAELVVIVLVALGLALAVQAFLVKPYEIPSASMEPTLHINQRVLVDRVGNHFGSPSIGDIVVFHPPASETCANSKEGENDAGQQWPSACDAVQSKESSQTFIKRVVGLPGDRLSISHGNVIRNGAREKAPYVIQCGNGGACNFPATIKVPRGDYYMMGDNRPDSLDSRFWGPVPRSWIIGKAFFTYWPPDRVGFL
jgi:signal peptidase I